MRRVALAVIGVVALVQPSLAAPPRQKAPSLDEVNNASFVPSVGKGIDGATLKAQVILDRLRFSPGVIDGLGGDNFSKAVEAYEKAQGLKADGKLDPEVWSKLTGASAEPVLIEYAITDEDLKGPFVAIPERFEDKAGLPRLGYASVEELLAEKFHMDRDLLAALNPGRRFDRAGTSIVVAEVRRSDDPKEEKVARIEVDKKGRALRALAADGKPMAVYPASIGSKEKPAPTGSHTVRAIAPNPSYTYNPDYKFKGVKAKEKFEIKPGPNNPVGTAWIDLSAETFGIHGTPDPENVGKVASHGCVRLTNWDVEELSRMVQKGTPVVFLD